MKKVLLLFVSVLSLSAIAQQTVTFTVNIPGDPCNPTVVDSVTVTGNWVNAAGLGADWSASLKLTNTTGSTYAGTATLPAGSYEYKFRKHVAGGTEWEGVPNACAVNGNRALNVAMAPVAAGPWCFASCDPTCGSATCVAVTLSVDMNGVIAAGRTVPDTVHVAGSFQGWNPGATFMTDPDNDKVYTRTLNVPSGNYEFKFVNGNAWGTDEAIPCGCATNGNRSISIPSGAGTFNFATCFGLCSSTCSSAGARNVTFGVDLNGNFPDANGVKVRIYKPFADTIALTQVSGDWYQATVSMNPGDYVYDFINGSDENFSAGFTCGCEYFGGDRRRSLNVTAGMGTMVLPTYIYDDCIVSTVSVDAVGNPMGMVAQPNPFNGSTVITFESSDVLNLQLTNVAGQVVFTQNNISGNQVAVNRNGLASGMYYATLMNESGSRSVIKLVIQ